MSEIRIEPRAQTSGVDIWCRYDEIDDVTSLIENPRNPNQHPDKQIAMLAKIIKAQGWRQPITISNRSGFIVKGHGRLQAARLLQVEGVPVEYQDYENEAAEYADLIADNRIAELAEIDSSILSGLLSDELFEDFDMGLTGFDPESLGDLLEDPINEGLTEEDEVPEVPEEPTAKLGQIWKLGDHRLTCGDSTNREDVEKLMDSQKADMVFTDPPYGISHSGKGIDGATLGEDFGEILGDSDTTVAAMAYVLCAEMFPESTHIFWGANYYPDVFPCGFGWLVWDKQREGNTFSGAELAFVNRGVRLDVFRHMWHGMVKASEHGQKRVHPTQKPIALSEWCFESYGNPKTVLDLFLGSGSTIIACEKTNRKCFGMELDPKYCDVIIKRWEDFTGKTAELLTNG